MNAYNKGEISVYIVVVLKREIIDILNDDRNNNSNIILGRAFNNQYIP